MKTKRHLPTQLTVISAVVTLLLACPPLLTGNTTNVTHGTAGLYELSFFTSFGPAMVDNTLLVGQELILKAAVTDSFGSPATRGSVTFQMCSLQGGRSLQRDPAPSSACDVEGTGTWVYLITMKVDEGTCPGLGPGYACVNAGFVQNPRTIGFRFRYTSQGSGIASAISQSRDATWILP